jgi:transposase InsO family protein
VSDVIRYFHVDAFGAHQGFERDMAVIGKHFFWPGMRSKILAAVKACAMCQRVKGGVRRKIGLQVLFPEDGPWITIAIDLAGPLPHTKDGFLYILIIVERFTRFAVLVAIRNKKPATIAKALEDNWLLKHGTPKRILSDRGGEFRNAVVAALGKLIGFHQAFTSGHHPQTNGMAEKMVHFTKTRLTLLNEQGKLRAEDGTANWDSFLPAIAAAYNAAPSKATGLAPFELTYGRQWQFPIMTRLAADDEAIKQPDGREYLDKLQDRLDVLRNKAKETGGRYDKLRRKRANRTRKAVTYRPGQEVFIYNHEHGAFDGPWLGPFRVKSMVNDSSVQLEDGRVVNTSSIKE